MFLPTMKTSLLTLASLIVAAGVVLAEESIVNVRVEVQMVTMALDKGLPLLPNLRDPGSIDGALSKIQKMIEEGEAVLIGRPQVVTKSRQRAVNEDIREVRYATEFDGEEVAKAPAGDKKPPQKKAAHPMRAGAPVPTAIETRNVGSTLEVEAVVGPDGKTIDVNLVPQSTRLLEFRTVASGHDANGHDWSIEQPIFYTAKTTTSLTLSSGKPVLLAEFRGPEGSDQIQFFILKAEVVTVAAAKDK
jgi:hypothetical protein